MAWTIPKTWQVDELVTAAALNAQLRDNLLALKAPPTHAVMHDQGGYYSTNSSTWSAVDATNLKLTLTTSGGDVMLGFCGVFNGPQKSVAQLDIQVDGLTRLGAAYDAGLGAQAIDTTPTLVSLGPLLITGLAEGEHTFELMWRTIGTAVWLQSQSIANGGSGNTSAPVMFWAREIS